MKNKRAHKNSLCNFFPKNRKGVSEIIGYILMIAIVVAISVFVYQFLKSYVPKDTLTCPDGVTIIIPDYKYNCTANMLNFTLQNEGTFSIGGYFIHASNSSQGIATIDLTHYYTGTYQLSSGAISFGFTNVLDPGKIVPKVSNGFNLSIIPPITGTLNRIEIIPMRYVVYQGKNRTASCGNAKISLPIACN
jgi:flagellin-like protein